MYISYLNYLGLSFFCDFCDVIQMHVLARYSLTFMLFSAPD